MTSKFKNRLKAMQDGWENNREFEPNVPEGIYQMQLQSAELCESKSSGNLQIRRIHLVIDGEYANETVKDYLQMETEKGPAFVAGWLEDMDYEVPEDIMKIEGILEKMTNASPTVQAEVTSSKGGFTNVRIKKLLDEGSVSLGSTDSDDDGSGSNGTSEFWLRGWRKSADVSW